ncbi:hypothetical protein A9K55_004399 [Cordyceps militaris]|uniref:Uncharacterized protein n=1 Tax=Cordyceps militaris TaxID=73501 RepID=A0A2H4SNE3_CORMI|nr:hypothetical protein A9K55_004399 [Cordyceps militaris]
MRSARGQLQYQVLPLLKYKCLAPNPPQQMKVLIQVTMDLSRGINDDFTRALVSQATALEIYEGSPSLLDERLEERLNNPPSPKHCDYQFSALNLGIIEHFGVLHEEVIDVEKEIYRQHEATLRRQITINDVIEYDKRLKTNANPNIECSSVGRPEARILTEAGLEWKRMMLFLGNADQCNNGTAQELHALDIVDRKSMARYFVWERWRNIGAWNRDWMVTATPKANWRWPWQKRRPEEDGEGNLRLLRDAIEACGDMRPGQYGKLSKETARHQCPKEGWTSYQGDEFIRSRPWFAFEVECMVESTRRGGVELEGEQCWPTAPGDFIRRQWMDEGIWNNDWDHLEAVRIEPNVGWRWAEEGQEPGYADLGVLKYMHVILPMLKRRRSRRNEMREAAEAARAVQESRPVPPAPVRRRRRRLPAPRREQPRPERRPVAPRRERERREPTRIQPARPAKQKNSLEQPQPEQLQPEQPQPEQPQPEQPQPEQPQPEQPQPEQPQPEQPQPEQPQPEQPRPEQPQPERRPMAPRRERERREPTRIQPARPAKQKNRLEQPQPEQLQPEQPQPE